MVLFDPHKTWPRVELPCQLCARRQGTLAWIGDDRPMIRVCDRWWCRFKLLLMQLAAAKRNKG